MLETMFLHQQHRFFLFSLYLPLENLKIKVLKSIFLFEDGRLLGSSAV
jgi:hypothetical protein